MSKVSVIIPLAPDETEHTVLLDSLPDDMEIILSQKVSRAQSLNDGAKAAKGEYLWFLHADSRLAGDTLPALFSAIETHQNSLLYFDLAFLSDASPLMVLNAWGVRFRSRICKTPFGDQGFCIRKDLFEKIGGYPDDTPYGEDHVFVWKARQQGIDIEPAGAKLYTSARKYKKYGWLKTTSLHLYLWVKQAWPQWKELRRRNV